MSRREAGLRADLHVHSRHSGRTSLPLFGRVAQECYAEPREVYDAARRNGMDLVTLTDHDSIEGGLALAGLPGTFLGEEVTCVLPGDRELHLGVLDLSEAQHAVIAGRRRDAEALFAYLAEQRLPVIANHPFAALTGRRELADIHRLLGQATHVEVLNGAMPASSNAWARRAAFLTGLPTVGGSDAHTLAGVASACTIVPGAATREDFLDGLREGRTIPAGRSGSYARLTLAIADLVASACGAALEGGRGAGATAATAIAFLAAPLLPLVTAAVFAEEILFARRHGTAFERARAGMPSGAGRLRLAATGEAA